jgi:hypothetical protein
MNVSGIAVSSFSHSALVVSGNFRCHYFYGVDISVIVGGSINLEYGDGYGEPLGYIHSNNALEHAVFPKHDEESSLALLNLTDGEDNANTLVERIKAHEMLFTAHQRL